MDYERCWQELNKKIDAETNILKAEIMRNLYKCVDDILKGQLRLIENIKSEMQSIEKEATDE